METIRKNSSNTIFTSLQYVRKDTMKGRNMTGRKEKRIEGRRKEGRMEWLQNTRMERYTREEAKGNKGKEHRPEDWKYERHDSHLFSTDVCISSNYQSYGNQARHTHTALLTRLFYDKSCTLTTEHKERTVGDIWQNIVAGQGCPNIHHTAKVASSDTSSDLYSGGAQFESRPGNRPLWGFSWSPWVARAKFKESNLN